MEVEVSTPGESSLHCQVKILAHLFLLKVIRRVPGSRGAVLFFSDPPDLPMSRLRWNLDQFHCLARPGEVDGRDNPLCPEKSGNMASFVRRFITLQSPRINDPLRRPHARFSRTHLYSTWNSVATHLPRYCRGALVQPSAFV